jgi:MFS family permease
MRRVPRTARVHLAAPPHAVRDAAVADFGAIQQGDSRRLLVKAPDNQQPAISLTIRLTPNGSGTDVAVSSDGGIDIPFFGWFFRPLVAIAHRRARTHAVAVLRATTTGAPRPATPGGVFGLPPVAFTSQQSVLLATASAATAVVAFSAALFGQFNDPISETFDASDARMGTALATTRFGALLALVAVALADRRGRRRAILIGVAGSAACCAVSAAAPGLVLLTGVQLLQRGFVITTATVSGIAVIEEAPEGARAYAASMLALAGGFGFSISVVMLPFADAASWGWRIPFGIGALTILLARPIGRHLAETTRYTRLAVRTDVVRGRFGDVWRYHRRRFVLLGVIAFLTNVFNAPSSQFMNKYLTDEHDFSNTSVALFRGVTTAVPGLIGLVVGGRLAEARGRRPVAAIALAIATATQMVFFLSGGATLWIASATSILMSGAGGIALGTLDAELFPTEVRSTSNALLIVVGVLGSSAGLIASGWLSDPLGGLGRSIALMGVGSLLVAIFVIPLLPEPRAHDLDEISPIHISGEEHYRPDP